MTLSLAAWGALAWLQIGSAPGGHVHASAAGPDRAAGGVLGAMMLMPLAMMAPLVLGGVRYASLSTYWQRRHRAALLYLIGFLAVWIVISAVMTTAWSLLARQADMPLVTALAFVVAAGWQFTSAKRRALRRCERRISVPGDGWRADRRCLTNGLDAGISCGGVCWALMGAATVAHHALPIMIALFALQLYERRAWRYEPKPIAAWVAGVGVVTLLTLQAPPLTP